MIGSVIGWLVGKIVDRKLVELGEPEQDEEVSFHNPIRARPPREEDEEEA